MRACRSISWKALFSLIRPLNAGITALCIGSMGIIAHAPGSQYPHILWGALAGFFITAFGNVSNDIFDIGIDSINKPSRPLPAGTVTINQAFILVYSCLIAGFAIAGVLGPMEFLFVSVTAAVLTVYNLILKRVPLAGNLTVGALTGAAFLFGGVLVDNLHAAIFPSVFAFLVNALRELIKDAEDIQGDAQYGVHTFPQRYGSKATAILGTALGLLLVAATVIPVLHGTYSAEYYGSIVCIGVDIPVIVLLGGLWSNFSPQYISKMSILLKYIMILGLTAILTDMLMF